MFGSPCTSWKRDSSGIKACCLLLVPISQDPQLVLQYASCRPRLGENCSAQNPNVQLRSFGRVADVFKSRSWYEGRDVSFLSLAALLSQFTRATQIFTGMEFRVQTDCHEKLGSS